MPEHRVRGYHTSHREPLRFHNDNGIVTSYPEGDEVYLGVELELNFNTGDQDIIDGIFEQAQEMLSLETDSSLHSGGAEMVCNPMTYKFAVNFWKRFFKNVPSSFSRIGCWESGECAMHVHMSKSALRNIELRRVLIFLNDPNNKEFIAHVAQRPPQYYCRQKTIRNTRSRQLLQGDPHDGHYEILNLRNQNTMEFRMFRGSFRLSRVLKNLEFVMALATFARQWRKGYTGLSASAFCQFITKPKRAKNYPNLVKFILPFMANNNMVVSTDEEERSLPCAS